MKKLKKQEKRKKINMFFLPLNILKFIIKI